MSMRHELTSAFATVGLQAGVIKKYMPLLLEAYSQAVDKKLVAPDLAPRQIELMAECAEGLGEALERIKLLISETK